MPCLSETLDELLDAHEQAFTHFGGYTQEHLYDRPRTVCVPRGTDGVRWNTTFKAFADFWGFEPRLCRPYRAQTKGKVESGVKYFKRNFLAGRRFRDDLDFNEQLAEWMAPVADVSVHGTTHERPLDRRGAARRRDSGPGLLRSGLRPRGCGMMSPQMTRLDEHLQRLRLSAVRERLEALLQEAAAQELSYADFLDRLLSEEVEAKTAKHVTMRTSLARFPFIKGLDSFEFGYQPSVDRKQVQKLSLCHFVEHGENVVLLGGVGTGKTHLAIALGMACCQHDYRVRFLTAAELTTLLVEAQQQGRLARKLDHTRALRCLIID